MDLGVVPRRTLHKGPVRGDYHHVDKHRGAVQPGVPQPLLWPQPGSTTCAGAISRRLTCGLLLNTGNGGCGLVTHRRVCLLKSGNKLCREQASSGDESNLQGFPAKGSSSSLLRKSGARSRTEKYQKESCCHTCLTFHSQIVDPVNSTLSYKSISKSKNGMSRSMPLMSTSCTCSRSSSSSDCRSRTRLSSNSRSVSRSATSRVRCTSLR